MAKYSYSFRGSKGAGYSVEADSMAEAKAQAETYFASQKQSLRDSDSGKPNRVSLGSTGKFDANDGEIYFVKDQGYFQNVDGGTMQLTDNVNTWNLEPGLYDKLSAAEKDGTLNVQHAPSGIALDAKLKGNDPVFQSGNVQTQGGVVTDLDAKAAANTIAPKASSSSSKSNGPSATSSSSGKRTAVTLGNGKTMYVDTQGNYYDNPDGPIVPNPVTGKTSAQSSAPSVKAPTVSLAPGSSGSDVKALQDFLVASGYMTQAQVNTGYGNYGPQTTAAVQKYQEDKGVDNSTGPGYWGPRTIAASQSTPSTPQQSGISDPINVSNGGGLASAGGSLSLPKGSGTQQAVSYTTSLTTQISTLKDQIQKEADKKTKEYDVKIKALEQKEKELEQLQTEGLGDIEDATFREVAEKRAAYDLEKQRFDENYNANQALVGELDTLLTQGNTLIMQMQETTGLASIMSPRISKTMTDVAARAGVIEAVLNARNGQMANAQNQLQTSLGAISSIYEDEINYYKTAINFYGSLKGETTDKLAGLTAEQKEYADVKINMLANDLAQLQETAKLIQTAMLDPETAKIYGAAGVTLKDSVETIGQKVAQYEYSQEVIDIHNKMTTNGYSSKAISGVPPVAIMDSQGKVTNWYKAGGDGADFTLGTNQVRFDASGNVVASGPSDSSSGGADKLSNSDRQILLGAGIPSSDIPSIESDVSAYGVEKAIEGADLTTAQKNAIRKVYGAATKVTKTEVTVAIASEMSKDKDYVKKALTNAYTDEELKTLSKQYGYTSWFGFGSDKEAFLASPKAQSILVDLLYEQYKTAGIAE